MRFYNPFNKSLVGLLTLLFVLWLINDWDDVFEKEACSQYRPPVRPPPPPPPPPPVYCGGYRCPTSPKYDPNPRGMCCRYGPCRCSAGQCCRKRPCKYSGSGNKGGYSCLSTDQTCGASAGNVIGKIKINKSEPTAVVELARICDKSPTCQYIEYNGMDATLLKGGSCNALKDKTGLDIWARPRASTGGRAAEGDYPEYLKQATSGERNSGSKGTLSAAKSSKFKNPYAFGANENLCQGYCDGEKGCKAIHWERPKDGKLSRCYLRGGPVDPTKFKGAKAEGKEKFTIREGYVQLNPTNQNSIKKLLSCN